MSKTHNFKVGDRVQFSPTHQTDIKREGWITEVSDDHNVVDVELDPNKGEVSRVYQANAANCSLTAEQKENPFAKKRAEKKAAEAAEEKTA
jgi:hypothetical protein